VRHREIPPPVAHEIKQAQLQHYTKSPSNSNVLKVTLYHMIVLQMFLVACDQR
jgi:hypothetical protein